jgi:formamidopyrimidine-DNA glycosylase
MPEGPEVRRIGDSLNPIVGENIASLRIVNDQKFKFCRNGVPGKHLLNFPHTVESVKVKGKLIRINLSGDIAILNTLGMSGTWHLRGGNSIVMDPHYRLWFEMDRKSKCRFVIFKDQRSFGTIKIVTQEEADAKMKTIGHDLLSHPMASDKWDNLQSKANFKDKPIGEAIMNQKVMAGIGNIYKAEILHTVGIDPRTLVEDVKPKDWGLVNPVAHAILLKSFNAGGSSVRNYSVNGQQGNFQNQLRIYRKKVCPKGHATDKIKQNKRTTWWCPTCQTK